MKVIVEVSDLRVGDVVDNAFESGIISYWTSDAIRTGNDAQDFDSLSNSEYLRAGGVIRFTTEDDGYGTTHLLTWAKVEHAMRLINEKLPHIMGQIVDENYDANTSDLLVQFALFNEEVYG